MSQRIKKHQPFLHLLARSRPKQRKILLRQATKDELLSLFEICLNIIKGNIPLKAEDFKKLKRHKGLLRTLSDKKVTLKHKKKLINQKGGFIANLAAFAIPLIASLLKK